MAIIVFDSDAPVRETEISPSLVPSKSHMPFSNLQDMNGAPKAKLWLNLGYEANSRFVNLPIGIPVDTMKPAELKGQNEDWIKFQNARNQLLEGLQAMGAQLEPGQEIEIPNLVIKLRRVNGELDVTKEFNEYTVDLVSMLSMPAPQVHTETS